MPLPPFVKSPTFLTGLGASGSGAIGIGGWQIFEGAYPTANSQLSKSGFKWHPPSPVLDANASSIQYSSTNLSKFEFKPYGCFQNFFPNVEVAWGNQSSGDSTEVDTFNATQHEENELKSSVNPVGCAIMDFSYESGDKWILKSEVTVKNDRFGWVIWTGVQNLKSGTNSSSFNYHLLFLKKTEGNWDILGGYLWNDANFWGTSNGVSSVKIIAPGEEGNWLTNASTSPKRDYSGVWMYEEGSGKEIFEEVQIYSGSEQDYVEILGKQISDSAFKWKTTKVNLLGYGQSNVFYKKGEGWKKMSESKDISDAMDALYVPFKGKKGKWTKTSEYCSSRIQYNRWLPKDELNRFRDLCYRK